MIIIENNTENKNLTCYIHRYVKGTSQVLSDPMTKRVMRLTIFKYDVILTERLKNLLHSLI